MSLVSGVPGWMVTTRRSPSKEETRDVVRKYTRVRKAIIPFN
jgi:hypothetical protein